MFGLTLEQLSVLMKLRGKDLQEQLQAPEYNGTNGVLEKLKVDGAKGLDSSNKQDLEQRQTAYGKNEIPPKPMKSFFKLCWEALHDMLLVILLVCAVVSIGLSFYKPPKPADGKHEEEERKTFLINCYFILVLLRITSSKFEMNRKEEKG